MGLIEEAVERCGAGWKGFTRQWRAWEAGIGVQWRGLECRHIKKAAVINCSAEPTNHAQNQTRVLRVFWTGTAVDVSAWLGAWEGIADSGGVTALVKAAALGQRVGWL